jgi:hypothetical protein
VPHSYACRRGKGTHAALERAHRLARRFPFVLRGDIVQFFPSIDHGVLKAVVQSVQDEQFLTVLERVLDLDVVAPPLPHGVQGGPAPAGPVPGRGLPIGNLTARLSRKNDSRSSCVEAAGPNPSKSGPFEMTSKPNGLLCARLNVEIAESGTVLDRDVD